MGAGRTLGRATAGVPHSYNRTRDMSTLRQLLAMALYIVASNIGALRDAGMTVLIALVLGTALWLLIFGVLLLGPQP